MSRSKRGAKKQASTLKVLQTASESPAALGRTNMKKLLFFCAAEKMNVGFPGDLLASADAACSGWAVWAA